MIYKCKKQIIPNTNISGDITYNVYFLSQNPNVVSVNENGELIPLKYGSTVISITVVDSYGNTYTDTTKVNVKYTCFQWIIKLFFFGWIWY